MIDSIRGDLAIQLIRNELNKNSIQQRGFILEGFPRNYLEAVWLFHLRSEESNDQQIFEYIINQKKTNIKKKYIRNKENFFKEKDNEDSKIMKQDTDNSKPNFYTSSIQVSKRLNVFNKIEGLDFEDLKFWSIFLNSEYIEMLRKCHWTDDEQDNPENDYLLNFNDSDIPNQDDDESEETDSKLILDMKNYFNEDNFQNNIFNEHLQSVEIDYLKEFIQNSKNESYEDKKWVTDLYKNKFSK